MKELYMKKAIEMAKRGIGFVNPDPLAGAVIVEEGNIVGQGYHKSYKSERAELVAINDLKHKVFNGQLFINIEPELDAKDDKYISYILDSGIKRIYIGMMNPKHGSSGIFKKVFNPLGIEVEYNILEEECEELNEIYKYYISTNIPFVFTKWAMTLDGKLASRTGDSKWISGEKSLEFVHHLRQRVAAIMVGENTVRMDNPMLTTRLKNVKISNPLRVIVSKYGEIPLDSNILKIDDETKTLIIVSDKISGEKEDQLRGFGVEVLRLKEVDGRISFKDILKALGERNVDSLYIEGGSSLLASAFESGVVNKVYAAVAPKIIGGKDAITPVGGKGIEKMNDAIRLKRVTHEIIGDDVIFKGYI